MGLISDEIEKIASTPYHFKDAKKFKRCNKLIARGVFGSSSWLYAQNCSSVNTGIYTQDDIVGVSVNGGRASRLRFSESEVLLAISAGAVIITDCLLDRNRKFNVGEREIAKFLMANGYEEINGNGIWYPRITNIDIIS